LQNDSYTLQYASDPSFAEATTVEGIAETTYTVPGMAALDTAPCFWRVDAVDSVDNHSGYQVHPFRFGLFVAGDQNQDDAVTASDVIHSVNYVFKSGPAPLPCEAVGDVNCDGTVTAADLIYLVTHTFKSGPPPCNVGDLIADGAWSCP
jgi:hypothetical protein